MLLKTKIIMKDRKTRTREIREQWIEKTKIVRESFWGRQAYVAFFPDDCPYSPPKRRAFGFPEVWWQEKLLDLEWIYDKRGYNEIYKQHVMAYRIINRWRSARINLNTPLGQKVAAKLADEYEQGV